MPIFSKEYMFRVNNSRSSTRKPWTARKSRWKEGFIQVNRNGFLLYYHWKSNEKPFFIYISFTKVYFTSTFFIIAERCKYEYILSDTLCLSSLFDDKAVHLDSIHKVSIFFVRASNWSFRTAYAKTNYITQIGWKVFKRDISNSFIIYHQPWSILYIRLSWYWTILWVKIFCENKMIHITFL